MKKIPGLVLCLVLLHGLLSAQHADTDKVNNGKQYINVYDARGNKTSRVWQELKSAWVNKVKETYTYDKHNNMTVKLVQAWYNKDWVNVEVYDYLYSKQDIQTNVTHQVWYNSEWEVPSADNNYGELRRGDHVQWKNEDNSMSTGIIVGLSKMGTCSIKPDYDTTKTLRISFLALQHIKGSVNNYHPNTNIYVARPPVNNVPKPDQPETSLPDSLSNTTNKHKEEAKNLLVNGVKEGWWLEYLYAPFGTTTTQTNTACYRITNYKHGKPDGNEYIYQLNTLLWKIPYKRGKINGISTKYFPNGNVANETPYTDSVINGTEKTYWENGALWEVMNFVDGKEIGFETSYYSNGVLKSKSLPPDSKGNVVQINYYPSGKLMSQITCTNYKRNGLEKDYYETGVLQAERMYTDGYYNGDIKEYYENGKIMAITPYVMGNREGVVKEYYESGMLKSEFLYTRDINNGQGKSYYESGALWIDCGEDLISREYYESGKLKKITPLMPNNQWKPGLMRHWFVEPVPKATVTEYYESGGVKAEYPYKDGVKDGVEKEYYEDGKLKSETIWTNNRFGGTKNYDENGNEIK